MATCEYTYSTAKKQKKGSFEGTYYMSNRLEGRESFSFLFWKEMGDEL
jgi:hypothetical protein